MLSGLEGLPSGWNSGSQGESGLAPLSQAEGLSSLMTDPAFMSSQLDAFIDSFPIPSSVPQASTYPFWNTPALEFPPSTQPWAQGPSQSQGAVFPDIEGYSFEGQSLASKSILHAV